MKKIFGFWNKKDGETPVTSTRLGRENLRLGEEKESVNAQPGYNIQDKDLGKIHKAASEGNVARVQQILLLGKNGVNDRDRRNRTPLHLACVNGYPEVVTLLVERKCDLHLRDNKDRTALIKAVQCQQQECVTILLEHGADPNLIDVYANTALHYAACGQNISIAANLLSHNANIEARNKEDFTPVLLAISESNEQMVEFLVKLGANIHAVDKIKRTALMIAVNTDSTNIVRFLLDQGVDTFAKDFCGWTAENYAHFSGFKIHCQMISDFREKRSKNTSPVDEKSDEDSLTRLPNTTIMDDEDFHVSIKTAPKPRLTKLMTACQQSRKNIADIPVIVKMEDITLFEDGTSDSKGEDVVESLPKPSLFKAQDSSPSALLSALPPLKSPLNFSAVSGATNPRPEMKDSAPDETTGLKDVRTSKSVDERSDEDSLSRLSDKPGIDESWPSSDDEDLDFSIKNGPKPNLAKLMSAIHQSRTYKETPGIVRPESKTLFEESHFDSEDEDVVETLPKPSFRAQGFSHSAFWSTDPPLKSSLSFSFVSGATNEGATRAAFETRENVLDTACAPEEQRKNDTLSCEDGADRKNRNDKMSTLGLGEEKDEESPWDSESISERLPQKYTGHVSEPADQKEENMFSVQIEDCMKCASFVTHLVSMPFRPRTEMKDSAPDEARGLKDVRTSKSDCMKYTSFVTHLVPKPIQPCTEMKDSAPDKAAGLKDMQTSKSERELKMTLVEEQERPDKRANKSQNAVVLKRCTSAEKTCENQFKSMNLPHLHLPKMPPEPEMIKECDREEMSVYPGLPCVQKYGEMWIRQGKLELRSDLKRIRKEFTQKFWEIFPKTKLAPYPKQEPLCYTSKEGANSKEIPSDFTENVVDCEENDIFGVSASVGCQAFPEEREPGLKTVFPSHLHSGSQPCQSSSKLYFNDNKLNFEKAHKPDTEHISNENKDSLYNDVENEELTAEVREDQESDTQMTTTVNRNENATKWTLDVKQMPQRSDPKRLSDLWLTFSSERKHTFQIKSHNPSAVKNTPEKTKPTQDLFQEPFQDNCSANKYKDKKSELECVTSSVPYNEKTLKVHLNEESQQVMKEFKKDVGMLHTEFLAFERKKSHLQKEVEKKGKQFKSNELEVAEHMQDPVAGNGADGLIQQGKSGKTDTRQFSTKETGDTDRAAEKTSEEKIKVQKQINSMDDPDDFSQPSEAPRTWLQANCVLLIEPLGMECKDSARLLKVQDVIHSRRRLAERERSCCEQLTCKIEKMESKASALRKELSEMIEIKSQLECQNMEMKKEVHNLRMSKCRFTLKEEKQKRTHSSKLLQKNRKQLRRIEEQYSKEAEMKQHTLQALAMQSKTVRSDLNQVVEEGNDAQRQLSREQNDRMLQDGILTIQLCRQQEKQMAQKNTMQNSEVSSSNKKEEDLLHENHMLQDEIARLTLERDTLKNQNQEKEKKYSEDIAILKERNDDLQKTLKQNEETSTKAILQYSGQIDVLKAENTTLNSELENERQNNKRIEKEAESYRSRLAAAVRGLNRGQTLRRDVECAFDKATEEWDHVMARMASDVSNLLGVCTKVSKAASKTERNFCSLEIELHHTKEALREKTLILESVQRELNEKECQMKAIEHMYQNEHGKVNKSIAKQQSIEEQLSQLQSENMLLRQQLDDAHNKANNKENVEDQLPNMVKQLRAENENQNLRLEERHKELFEECNRLKEWLYQSENEKAGREVSIEKDIFKLLERNSEWTDQRPAEICAELLVGSKFSLSPLRIPTIREPLLALNSSLAPRRNLVTSTLRISPSNDSIVSYFTKVQKEFEKTLARELAEEGRLESYSRSPYNSNLNDNPVLKAAEEYKTILKKNYMPL